MSDNTAYVLVFFILMAAICSPLAIVKFSEAMKQDCISPGPLVASDYYTPEEADHD